MNASSHPEIVRRLVQAFLAEHGVAAGEQRRMVDTLLLRDGKYVGRSFRCGGFLAMWMIEAGVVTFYDDAGEILQIASVREAAEAASIDETPLQMPSRDARPERKDRGRSSRAA